MIVNYIWINSYINSAKPNWSNMLTRYLIDSKQLRPNPVESSQY